MRRGRHLRASMKQLANHKAAGCSGAKPEGNICFFGLVQLKPGCFFFVFFDHTDLVCCWKWATRVNVLNLEMAIIGPL